MMDQRNHDVEEASPTQRPRNDKTTGRCGIDHTRSHKDYSTPSPLDSESLQTALDQIFDAYTNSYGYWDSQRFLQFVSDCPGLIPRTEESTVDVASMMECFFQEATPFECYDTDKCDTEIRRLLPRQDLGCLVQRLALLCYSFETPSKSLWQFLTKHVFTLAIHHGAEGQKNIHRHQKTNTCHNFDTSLIRILETYRDAFYRLQDEIKARQGEERRIREILEPNASLCNFTCGREEYSLVDLVKQLADGSTKRREAKTHDRDLSDAHELHGPNISRVSLDHATAEATTSIEPENVSQHELPVTREAQLDHVAAISELVYPSNISSLQKMRMRRKCNGLEEGIRNAKRHHDSIALYAKELKAFENFLKTTADQLYHGLKHYQPYPCARLSTVATKINDAVEWTIQNCDSQLGDVRAYLDSKATALRSTEGVVSGLHQRLFSQSRRRGRRRSREQRKNIKTIVSKLRFTKTSLDGLKDHVDSVTADQRDILVQANFTVATLRLRLDEMRTFYKKQTELYENSLNKITSREKIRQQGFKDTLKKLSSIRESLNSIKSVAVYSQTSTDPLEIQSSISGMLASMKSRTKSLLHELQSSHCLRLAIAPTNDKRTLQERLNLMHEDYRSLSVSKAVNERRTQMEIEDLRSNLLRSRPFYGGILNLTASSMRMHSSPGANTTVYDFLCGSSTGQTFGVLPTSRWQQHSSYPSYSSGAIPGYQDQYLRWWDTIRHQIPPGLRRNLADIGSASAFQVNHHASDDIQRG